MSGISLTSTTNILQSSFSDQAIKLIELKLSSTEAEVSKLSMLLADDDSQMSHTDVRSSNGITSLSGDDALATTKWTFDVISPVLANVSETDTSEGAVVSRVCRLEGAVGSFRSTIARVSHERDYWRREKLASDERFTRATDDFRTEVTRLRKDAKTECSRAAETKEMAEKTAEHLHNDLLQSVSSLVRVKFMSLGYCCCWYYCCH